MSNRTVTVQVPATTANLGSGFDAVGLALTMFADVTLTRATGPARRRRADPMRRMVLTAARSAFRHAEQPYPRSLRVDTESEVPLGRGLGASAIARAAGLVGANALMGGLLDAEALLSLGAELEGHADNIAPALFGGLQVVAISGARVHCVAVPLAPGLRCAGFIPDLIMPTRESRDLLPKRLSRADAVHNSTRAALLVAALMTGRWEALDSATDDRLHQRARSKLFPKLFDLFAAAMSAGAHAAYLSGGGSTIIALVDRAHAEPVRDALQAAAESFGVAGRPFIADPCDDGARVVAQG